MKATTKLFTVSAIAAATYGALQALGRRRAHRSKNIDDRFDTSDVRRPSQVQDTSAIGDTNDVQTPVVVTEEVVVITEAGPYEVDLELVPASDRQPGR